MRQSAFEQLHSPKSAQNRGYFENALQIRPFCASPEPRKRCSRAPKARAEKIWSILYAFYAKVTFVPLCLPKSTQNAEFFENVQRTSALCALPEPRENGARERRRRERRKFEAFYASFTQKRLLHYFAWHKVHKKHTVLLEYSKDYEYEGFSRASRTKRKRSRERRRRERRKFGA